MNNNKIFIFHTNPVGKGKIKRRITIAARIEGKHLDIAIGRCSKQDQFCKKIGRMIAIGRLTKGVLFDKKYIRKEDFNGKDFIHICNELIVSKKVLSKSPKNIIPKKPVESKFKTTE